MLGFQLTTTSAPCGVLPLLLYYILKDIEKTLCIYTVDIDLLDCLLLYRYKVFTP